MSTPTDPRATLRGFFTPGANNKVTPARLKATTLDGSDFSYYSRYEAVGYETWEPLESLFFGTTNYDGIFNIVDLGSTVHIGASGPDYRLVSVGVQPIVVDKRKDHNSMRIIGHTAVWAMRAEVDLVLDAYYRTSDGNLKWAGGHRPGYVQSNIIYGPMVETITQVYLETTSGTALAAEKHQRYTNIYLGYSAATPGTTYRNLTGNIVDFRKGMIHPVTWQDVANTKSVTTATQGHQNWWFEIEIEGDCHDMFYTQPVTGAGGTPALVVKGDGGRIAYMRVIEAIRAGDGTSKTRTWTLADSGSSTYAYITDAQYPNAFTSIYRGISNGISYADA